MKKRLLTGIIFSVAALSLIPGAVFAHVVVTPTTAGIGDHVTFSVSVPNEEQVAVTNLKLDIPDGVTDVTPTSKDGWTITTTKKGDDISEIIWSNGEIPVGQRQDFSFSAQAPAKAGDVDWKAYQTYADGTIVHWDQTPTSSDDATGNAEPYSVTKVSDDLTNPTTVTSSSSNMLPIVLSVVAIILSIGSILIRKRR
jgi:uncharacterized protein YcnI